MNFKHSLTALAAAISVTAGTASAYSELDANADKFDKTVHSYLQETGEAATVQVINGKALLQGDILVGTEEDVKTFGIEPLVVRKANVSDTPDTYEQDGAFIARSSWGGKTTWPNGIVPYEFAAEYPKHLREKMKTGMKWIEEVANIKFIERTTEKNYIHIFEDGGAYSLLGMTGGRQPLSYTDGYALGTTAHELMHALGFMHEQTRNDRDDYVTIHWNNISDDWKGQYRKLGSYSLKHGSYGYDYHSIMHYGGGRSMSTKDPKFQRVIGQREKLSEGDIKALQSAYGKPEAKVTNTAPSLSLSSSSTSLVAGSNYGLRVRVSDGETQASQLTVTAQSNNQAVLANYDISVKPGRDSNERLVMLQTRQQTSGGKASVSVQVVDGHGYSTKHNFVLSVSPKKVTVTPKPTKPTTTTNVNATRTSSYKSFITESNKNLCLDIKGGSAKASASVVVQPCKTQYSQQWATFSDGTIRPRQTTSLCLDINSKNQNLTQLNKCNGQNSQKWNVNGKFIKNASSNYSVLDVFYSHPYGQGAHVGIWPKHGYNNQQWNLGQEPVQKVSSVADVYKHCGFGGYKVSLKPGRYTLKQLQAKGMKNDDISSLKVSAGYEVVLYQHDQFNGWRKTLNSDTSCFVEYGINDHISSIEVRKK
ncbi:M12 family metallopeptidase [Spartinivicinus poritis]|uniref:M12 family metallopeptidase n=1 Tax=Spartinivicinus poritis TaxID=2994640 RepID=A0ABT5UFH4_9GAMM|nr:M12 family metallopeptidase [Spartinivicinus sp. A2-2]MDE1465098.1 M12 family metallopeptidase [Spartinivicinus sp. A2-2]